MNKEKNKNSRDQRRKNRVRAKITGTGERPRLAVSRSNKNISAQLIDDTKGVTLATASSGAGVANAKKAGTTLAKKAEAKKISTVVFDRGGNKYHGRVKALAEGAREGGLKF